MKHYFIIVPIMIYLLAGCSAQDQSTTMTFEAGGLSGRVSVLPANAKNLPKMTDVIATNLSRTMDLLSTDSQDNDLARLNRAGGSSRISLPPRVFGLIDLCRHYHEITDGAFDITTGHIAELWEQGIPDLKTLSDVMSHSGMQYVGTSENGSAILINPDIKVQPGHAATAYALDYGIVDTRRKFSGPAVVELGNLARSYGRFAIDNTPLLPIRIPERLDNSVIGHILFTSEKAVVNRILPHRKGRPSTESHEFLIDTRTGYPALGTRQVVVIGPLTIKAYALAEALLVLGKDEGENILPNFPDYDVMLIPDREPVKIWMTPGFKTQFKPSENIAELIRDWKREETEN